MKFKNKRDVRDFVWKRIERVAEFPFPVKGRIPNFKGAKKACEKIRRLKNYYDSEVIFCAPDSPLLRARQIVLEDGKLLLAPKPHFKGIIMIKGNPENAYLSRMLKYGVELKAETIREIVNEIGIFIQGCVAIDIEGNRIGKGTGYGDKEYEFLREKGLITSKTVYAVICHDLQIFDDLSYLMERHDVKSDVILTPKKILLTRVGRERDISILP